ncbi:MAG: site-specific integrase, partial [Acidimicrobiales bacterium]
MTGALARDAEEYLSWLAVEKGRSRNTLVAYRRDLAAWEHWAVDAGLDPLRATPESLESYLSDLRGEGRTAASVARATSALRGLFGFLASEGLAEHDPATDLRAPRLPKRLPKALEEHQVLLLLESVNGSDPLERRDRALLEVLYGTGARISEVVGLSLS